MNNVNAIGRALAKSIAIPFYRNHAGLLLFVFLLMFGTVESNQLVNYHRTLIEGMFGSGVFLLSVFVVWTLYAIKILQYVLTLLKQPAYAFLHHVTLRSPLLAFMQILMVSITCFMPVLVYSIVIYGVGIAKAETVTTLGIAAFQILLVAVIAGVAWLFLQTQHRFSWTIAGIRIPVLPGRIGFYISYLLGTERISLLISKAFSLGLLYLVRETIEVGDDFRIIGLTWVFVLLAHTFLVRKVQLFEDQYLEWMKNLPLTSVKIFGLYAVLYAGLLLPELTLIINLIDWAQFLMLMLLSAGMLMFVHAYLWKPNRDPEKFTVLLFWLLIVSFFVILSKLILPLALGLLVAASGRLVQRYYRYEPTVG